MMRMKYIVIDNNFPFIFSDLLIHSEFAESAIHHMMSNIAVKGYQVTSAGFVMNDPDRGLRCFGKSISLGVKSSDDDSKLLTSLLY